MVIHRFGHFIPGANWSAVDEFDEDSPAALPAIKAGEGSAVEEALQEARRW